MAPVVMHGPPTPHPLLPLRYIDRSRAKPNGSKICPGHDMTDRRLEAFALLWLVRSTMLPRRTSAYNRIRGRHQSANSAGSGHLID